MQDLTTGPVTKHLLKTTSFMLVTMVFQTLYFLVDLYWVGRLGTDAVAAVGIAGNLNFLVLALTQMLGVGTTTVVSHAAGRGDHEHALFAFNQSQVLGLVIGAVVLVLGLAARVAYATAMGADPRTAALAAQYLLWFIPALALQFAIVGMGAALRGTGNFRPGMIVGTATVIVNMVLAPFLIFGWGTGHPLGVAGASVSTLVAIAVGVVWLTTYFLPKVAPVAGQNFGARLAHRVKATFRDAALLAAGVMLAFALLCNIAPAALVGVFSRDPAAIAVGVEYLRIVSWNFVASGIVFVASSM